jgi:peroxiredoxin Q/BCP
MSSLPSAPSFSLLADDGTRVELAALRGQWVVLVFYPRDFSPVCTAQMCHYRDRWEVVRLPQTVFLGISPDTVERHQEFRRRHGLPFPLLSDPELEVFRQYGMLVAGIVPGRGLAVIDPEGRLRYRWRSWTGLRYPRAEEIRERLQRLQAER